MCPSLDFPLSFPFQSRSSFVLHICEIITVMRQRLIGLFVSHVHFLCGSFCFSFHFLFVLLSRSSCSELFAVRPLIVERSDKAFLERSIVRST